MVMLGLGCRASSPFSHALVFCSILSGVDYYFPLGRRTWRFVNIFSSQHTSQSTSFAIHL
jgi:hypothetical protein